MSWSPCKLLAWNAKSGSTQVAADHASRDTYEWRCLDQLQALCSVLPVQLRSCLGHCLVLRTSQQQS